MLSHIRETVDRLPDLELVDWALLDTQSLHSAAAGIMRMRAALDRNGLRTPVEASGPAQELLQRQLAALQQSASAPRRRLGGLTDHEIDAIPIVPCDHNMLASFKEAPSCVICHEEIKLNEKVRELPGCGHWYHASCIARWLRIKAVCPLCNAAVC